MRAGPTAATSFVGRRRELAALSRLLASTRLLTITGVGGSGKTRLAAALGARVRTASLAWVDLAQIVDPSEVAPAIERAIGAEGDGTLRTAAVSEALRAARALVVLDNCEHVLDGCRDAARRVLDADASVRIVATSRISLGIAEELAWRAPPLMLPSGSDGLGHGIRADAIRLFLERARGARPAFALDASTSACVTEICRRLEGLPLAIELAAARLRHMAVAELAESIGSPRVLSTDDGDPRHRTMTAALDWSYDLLDDQQRTLLSRVSVFPGGFTTAGAEAVSPERTDVGTVLGSLVDASVVEFRSSDERYRLLEPVRQYADERLRQREERERVTALAARYLVDLVTVTLGLESGPSRADLLVRSEFANAAALMPWLIRNDPGAALRLMSRFAHRYRNAVPAHLSVVRSWLARGLSAHQGRDLTRADALLAWGFMTWALDRERTAGPEMRRAVAEAREIAERIGNDSTTAQARLFDAIHAATYGPLDEALHAYDDLIPTVVQPRMLALAFSERAVLRQHAGDHEGARADIRDAFATWDRSGEPLWADRTLTMICAAEVSFVSGHADEATKQLRQAIAARRSTGEPQEAPPFVALASLAAATRDDERAVRLAGVADRLRQEVGSWLQPLSRLSDLSWLSRIEDRLGPRAARLRAEGRRMPLDLAIGYALGERASTGLTEREEAVARLVADGLTDKEIAAHLRISARTAENHVQRVRDKLGLRSRAQIARWVADPYGAGLGAASVSVGEGAPG